MKLQSRDGTVTTTLRLPKQTHRAVKAEASRRRMSMTLFIAELLAESMPTPKTKPRKQPA
jgi:predicted HicB family RNase H-like nuclease